MQVFTAPQKKIPPCRRMGSPPPLTFSSSGAFQQQVRRILRSHTSEIDPTPPEVGEIHERKANGATRGDQGRPLSMSISHMGRLAASKVRRTPADDLVAAATYPTETERSQIQEIVNPQQQEAAEAGTSVEEVSDPDGFRSDMTDRLGNYIDRVLPPAQARQASNVVLDVPELGALADIAQPEVNTYYGTYLTAAVHSPTDQAARAAYRLSEHIHEVPTSQNDQTDETALDWVASRMRREGGDLLRRYHVVSGDASARDQALFEGVRDHIFNLRTSDIRTIVLFHPGYEGGGEAYIQRHIAPDYAGQDPGETRRRGRWRTLATTIHEMLHAVVHEDFDTAARGLEESGIAVEGFAQYFTLPVYASLTERAAQDEAFRASVEGVAAPYLSPPDARGYESYVDGVNRIRDILGGNDENLKVAYFLGRIEYLGLGGWSESEASSRRFPGNTLGAAALLTDSGQGFFRVDYGRVLLGRGGAFQIQLGGTINYLTEGDRLGVGGTVAVQYSWPHFYVRAGVDVAASASVTEPFADSVRLDLLPGVQAGARIGMARVGAGAFLLIPVAGGPVNDRSLQLAAGLGASFDL